MEETGENDERITSEQVKFITEEIEKKLQDKILKKDTNTDQNKATHRKLKKPFQEFKNVRVAKRDTNWRSSVTETAIPRLTMMQPSCT